MQFHKHTNILIIGNGNIALQFSAIFSINNKVFLWGRNHEKSLDIQKHIPAISVLKELHNLTETIDFVFYCVTDSVINEVAKSTSALFPDSVAIHCSGSTPMSILEQTTANFGVFYPLQTFNKTIETNWKTIPILLEANNSETLEKINALATQFSENVQKITSDKRLKIHIAAVFTNNFINHLTFKSFDFLEKNNLEKSLLFPLLEKTFKNIVENNPKEIQTGPAKRNDIKTLDLHKNILSQNDSDLLEIYKAVSDSITKTYL